MFFYHDVCSQLYKYITVFINNTQFLTLRNELLNEDYDRVEANKQPLLTPPSVLFARAVLIHIVVQVTAERGFF